MHFSFDEYYVVSFTYLFWLVLVRSLSVSYLRGCLLLGSICVEYVFLFFCPKVVSTMVRFVSWMYKMDPIFAHPSVILFVFIGKFRSLILRVTNKEYLFIPVILLLRLLITPFSINNSVIIYYFCLLGYSWPLQTEIFLLVPL